MKNYNGYPKSVRRQRAAEKGHDEKEQTKKEILIEEVASWVKNLCGKEILTDVREQIDAIKEADVALRNAWWLENGETIMSKEQTEILKLADAVLNDVDNEYNFRRYQQWVSSPKSARLIGTE